MNLKKLLAISGIYSLVFVSVAAIIALEYANGALSPRGLGIALLLLVSASVCVSIILMRCLGRPLRDSPQTAAANDVEKRSRLWIRIGITMIALMALGLVSGLRMLGHAPLAPLLVGITMNLLITSYLIRLVMRMKRNLDASSTN